ncbi:MAG: TonB-dependent receptor [Saprospiraceae bacterium]|nr:TonB-dependent receptor [Saprospiraceae bacterium]
MKSTSTIRQIGQLVVCMVFSLTAGVVWSQSTVTGVVTDSENGEPLIGANVLVKGTTTGTITDFDGSYSVSVPDGANTLVISYTGYSELEVDIAGQSTIDVSLSAGTALDEIVVVGYGTVKKSDLTGAVTSVTEEDFNAGVITSPEQLLQGRAPGVQITSASGEPGAGMNVRIRGTSSVRSNNNPLFVVDGVPLSGDETSATGNAEGLGRTAAKNPLNFLNPNDIVSIDILKDASATAIYGSRGANGVVIITTKSGSQGSGVLDYDYSIGFSNISNRYDLLSRDEFLDAYTDFNGASAAASLDAGGNTDWQDELFRTGVTHSHNLSFGSGNELGNYRFSMSYFDQEGIIEDNGLQRISGRFNGQRKFLDNKLTISTQFTVANTHDDNVPNTDNSGFRGDLIGNIIKANPTMPVYNPDGTFYQDGGIVEPNPLAMIKLSQMFTNTLRSLGNISAEYQITDGLSFKTVVGFDQSVSSRTDAFSRDLVVGDIENIGRLSIDDISVSNKLWENFFTYTKSFGSIGFTGLLGYSYQEFDRSGKGLQYSQFRTSDLDVMVNNVSAAENSAGTNSFRTIDELQSYFGRVNLNISERFLLTGTLRVDGSTKFGPGNKYGYFPSFAGKWRLIQESFIPDVFSDLAVRVGWGLTGNQEIPHNLFTERQRYGGYDIDNGGTNINGGGLGTVAFANPDLKWEATSQINVGIDFGFSNNRISGSLDYYYKNTNDLLIQVTAAQPAVQPFVWTNLDADVINQGIELGLNIVAVDKSNFSWNINANAAYNDNVVENCNCLINTGRINGQGLTGAFAQRIADGQSLYAYFLREFGGYDSEGVSLYPNGDVQVFTGDSPLPTLNMGLTNSFTFGNFNASIFFSGQFGHTIYSNTANAYFTAGSLANGRNVTKDVVGNGEGRLNAPDVSTRFLEKGDFVRLQNASLGYTVPLSPDSKIQGLRLYFTGQNLAVFTSYSGQDPEVNVSKPIDGVPSFGIDFTTYPRARTFTLGANVQF